LGLAGQTGYDRDRNHRRDRQGRNDYDIIGSDGETTTIKARDPQKLDRVAVGDLVDITYTQAVAISVYAPKK
jgi:hypothetical protein